MTSSRVERAAATFVAVFSRYRVERGLTKKQLAAQMGFDPSYLSHIERGRHRPTSDFARRAELVLNAGGAIWQAFIEYDDARTAEVRGRRDLVPAQWRPAGPGLVVEREEATLSHRGDSYRCAVTRSLYNGGTDPVSRWLVRIAVDRYPQDAERSNHHHRLHPLTVSGLDLSATCVTGGSERMSWQVKHDRDATKEIWLLFENDAGKFPLYPGQRATIEYSYTVSEHLWGHWFQRAIRVPTDRLAIRLDLPQRPGPQVWGVETSLANGEAPLRTPVQRRADSGERAVFEWETDTPALHARYRLQWRYREPDGR